MVAVTRAILSSSIVLMPVCFLAWAESDTDLLCRDLLRVAAQRGEKYTEAREEFMRTHPGRADVEACAKISWEAGIMALIIEARRSRPDLYANWDGPGWRRAPRDILGVPGPHPAAREDAGLPFCIEAFYRSGADEWKIKDKRPRDAAEATLLRLPGAKPQGPVSLWRAVWKKAPPERALLRLHAASEIARVSAAEDLDSLKTAVQADPPDFALREIVVCSLPGGKDSTFQFLRDNFGYCKFPAYAAAVSTIASADSAEARRFLLALILNEDEQLIIRKAAAEACCANPKEEDIALADQLVRSGGDKNLAFAFALVAGWRNTRKAEQALPVVRAVTEATGDYQTRTNGVWFLLTRGTREDLPLLRKVIKEAQLRGPIEDIHKKLREIEAQGEVKEPSRATPKEQF